VNPLIKSLVLETARAIFPVTARKTPPGSPLFSFQGGLSAAAGPAIVSYFSTFLSPFVAVFVNRFRRTTVGADGIDQRLRNQHFLLDRAPVTLCHTEPD